MVGLRPEIRAACAFLGLSGMAFAIVGNLTASVLTSLIGVLLVAVALLPVGIIKVAQWGHPQ